MSAKAMRIRGGSGLGDSIYVRPVAEEYLRRGHAVEVCTNYPDVFIGCGARVLPFSRTKIDVLAHYTRGKLDPKTTQWQDVCIAAKVEPSLPLRFEWSVRNTALVSRMLAGADGRPIVLVHGGRTPMGRTDGYGAELLPERSAFDAALMALDGCFTVRVGGGSDERYGLATRTNLSGETSVSDLLDLAVSCDGILAQCSFAVPLAEAFDKPLLAVWSAKGLRAKQSFISSIKPGKILSGARSRYVVDDWTAERIAEVALDTFNFQECCT